MFKFLLLSLLGFTVSSPGRTEETKRPETPSFLSYVNILQGTDSSVGLSHGNTLPLVGMPWGMSDWAIQSEEAKGFFRPNGKISGFRETHEPSPWMGDYGQFVVMPQEGDLKMDFKGRTSEYDLSSSVLQPDYVRVDLKKYQITAELTATERCAVFRWTFHQAGEGRLILNTFGNSEIQVIGRTIRGVSRANRGGVGKDFGLFFVVELDRDIDKSETLLKEIPTGKSTVQGDGSQAYVEFKTSPNVPMEFKVGTSFLGWDQAEQNLKVETNGGFDAVHARVQETWSHNLGRIEIEATEDQKKTFYSCLYRAQMFPHRLYELDPEGKPRHYSPYDSKVHDGVLYGDIGIWDAFRTTFPLITILYPDQLSEILQGFVNASTEGGTLPEWPSPGYRDCMIGQHCAAIFADAVIKGVGKFDVATAYASLRKSAFQPPGHGELVRKGLTNYLKLGYLPGGTSTYPVSATLDYAYDDWCVAQIAKTQNRAEDYQALMARSQNYRLLWDPSVGFMRAKTATGQWVEPFDEFSWGGPYAESGPWQSSWFVPHDPAGLIELVGGREKFAAKLDQMLTLPPTFHTTGYGHLIHEMTEMAVANFGQYAQSNQPSFNNLYLFTAVGQPWKTEYWTRRICAEMYNSGPKGFSGDEDNGSMASWYLFSSMGFYPFCPGTTTFLFTSPLFTKTTLHLPGEKSFVITAPLNSDKNVYVQHRQLNGAETVRTGMTFAEMIGGGTLNVEMGSSANVREVAIKDLPYSVTPYK